jgi:hypothetical protein
LSTAPVDSPYQRVDGFSSEKNLTLARKVTIRRLSNQELAQRLQAVTTSGNKIPREVRRLTIDEAVKRLEET